ncbi:hypothetical protein ABIA35_000884 [Catenulispora sp. MAP12-49]|uniref:hypothetical protein n=1 Tax=Catenulispora sp. MAP12-49 TaxID=3156302 RepID=UPI0035181A40
MRQEQWLSQAVEVGKISSLPRWDAQIPLTAKGTGDPRDTPPRRKEALERISKQLPRVAHHPGGTARLLLLVLEQVEEAWEVSYIFEPLWDTLHGAQDCLWENTDLYTGNGDDARATQAALALLESLDAQILAEDSLVSGLLMERAEACDRAAEEAQRAMETVDEVPSDFGGNVRDLIRAKAIPYLTCYSSLASATRALVSCYNGDTDGYLEAAISNLGEMEKHPDMDPVMATELRAGRFSLTELLGRRADRWLRINRGKLVYIYPFGFKCTDPSATVADIGSLPELTLANAEGSQSELDLNDIWASSGTADRYTGCLIKLPAVSVWTSAAPSGRKLEELDARIVVSSFGNHYVRLEAELSEVYPPDLYQMLIRAAPESGRLLVGFADANSQNGQTWPRLSALAYSLANDLGAKLGYDPETVICRPALYHVIMSVEAASTTRGVASAHRAADRRETLKRADLRTAVGIELLTNPIPSLIGSMAEWIRYANLPDTSGSMEGALGEWVVRTCNTTSVIALGQSNFAIGTWIAATEFVASLDGLLEAWSSELFDHHNRTDGFERNWWEIEEPRDKSASEQVKPRQRRRDNRTATKKLSHDMTDERMQIEAFSVRLHATEAALSSASLVASPLTANILRGLLEMSGYPRKVEHIHHDMEFLSHGQLDEALKQLARELAAMERESQARRLALVTAVIAAMGISGLAQLLESGYQWHRTITILIVAVVIVIAIAVAVAQQTWAYVPRGRRK